MATLNELAQKLQEYIIDQQTDKHNSRNLSLDRYNNLKIKILNLSYPNVVVCVGISEATYNLNNGTKTDGGLGRDEKYVRKWLSKGTVISELKAMYLDITELVNVEEELEDENKENVGTAGEAKADIEDERKLKMRKMTTAYDEFQKEYYGSDKVIDKDSYKQASPFERYKGEEGESLAKMARKGPVNIYKEEENKQDDNQ